MERPIFSRECVNSIEQLRFRESSNLTYIGRQARAGVMRSRSDLVLIGVRVNMCRAGTFFVLLAGAVQLVGFLCNIGFSKFLTIYA